MADPKIEIQNINIMMRTKKKWFRLVTYVQYVIDFLYTDLEMISSKLI
jgi:hypothetical protein